MSAARDREQTALLLAQLAAAGVTEVRHELTARAHHKLLFTNRQGRRCILLYALSTDPMARQRNKSLLRRELSR